MQITLSPSSWLNKTDLLEYEGIPFWSQTEMDEIPITENDVYLVLTQQAAKRVDLIANDYYGDSALYWAILHANNIDLPNQLREGMEIRLPWIETIKTWLSQVS